MSYVNGLPYVIKSVDKGWKYSNDKGLRHQTMMGIEHDVQ